MTHDLSDHVLSRLREAAALMFWEAEAVRIRLEDPFRLASGNFSPIYINCRRVISEPAFMSLFVASGRTVLERAGAEYGAVAGGETAGIPFAAYLAQGTGRRMLYVRKKAKGYGIASKVEGQVRTGDRVLLVEDLITDGGSKIGFLEALREAGGEVTDAPGPLRPSTGGRRADGPPRREAPFGDGSYDRPRRGRGRQPAERPRSAGGGGLFPGPRKLASGAGSGVSSQLASSR